MKFDETVLIKSDYSYGFKLEIVSNLAVFYRPKYFLAKINLALVTACLKTCIITVIAVV